MNQSLYANLATERLTLIPQADADPEELVAGLNDFEVSRWLGRVPYPYTLADAHKFIARCREVPAPTWCITRDGHLVGGVGLDAHLGYWVARPHWGQGYATEAGRAVLAAHFADPATGHVESSYFLGNQSSKRVLEKLGFRDDGPRDIASVSQGQDMPGRRMVLTRAGFALSCDLRRADFGFIDRNTPA